MASNNLEDLVKTVQNLTLEVKKLTDAVNAVSRKQDTSQKSLDLLFNDRKILEDIQASNRYTQELLLNIRDHLDNKIKDVKYEVVDQGLKTQEKVEESTKDTVKGIAEAVTK